MKSKFERYNIASKPLRFKWFMRPITNTYAAIFCKTHEIKITYNNGAEYVKPPYLLLANHNSLIDFAPMFKVTKKVHASVVAEIASTQGRHYPMRLVGVFANRKFVNDPIIPMTIKKVLDRGDPVVIYPEARFSLCGTTAVLPESLGKMIKFYNVPVLTLMSHGHHINQPTWNQYKDRCIKGLRNDVTLLFNKEDIENMDVDEINANLVSAFQYDDFKWQKDNHISYSAPDRAEGLHHLLYKCPHCGTEFKMSSKGTKLICNHCKKEWEMTEYGELQALDGNTEYSHIPDWYEWERKCVQEEIEKGTYNTGEIPVIVKSLPNPKRWIDVGTGKLVHNMDGFKCVLDDPTKSDIPEIVRKPLDNYSAHIEYMFKKSPLECVDLSLKDDTWFCYPTIKNFSVTKLALAAEELYLNAKRKMGKEIKKGLA